MARDKAKEKHDAAVLKLTETKFLEFFKDQKVITETMRDENKWKEITGDIGNEVESDRFLELLFGYKPRINIECEEVNPRDDDKSEKG